MRLCLNMLIFMHNLGNWLITRSVWRLWVILLEKLYRQLSVTVHGLLDMLRLKICLF